MRRLCLSIVLSLLAAPALARPLTPADLVSLAHVDSPVISPDGRWLVWEQRAGDQATNRDRHSLWRMRLDGSGRADALPGLVGVEARDPAFGRDGRLYFLEPGTAGASAVFSIGMAGGAARQVTGDYDLGGFKIAPTGQAILVWADRPPGAKSLDDVGPPAAAGQGDAQIYNRLFVRHWNRWSDGRRSQLFVIPMTDGKAPGPGHAIEGALVGDAPRKPDGYGDQIAWSRDGRTVYFALKPAGDREPLSTNLDIFAAPADGASPPVNLTADNLAADNLPAVSPDGRWLAWTAASRPGYEDDRQVLMLRELATGHIRTVTGTWDRSVASIAWAADSAAIYVTAQEAPDRPVFRVRLADGAIHRETGAGYAGPVAALPTGGFVYVQHRATAPPDVWRMDPAGHAAQLTHANAEALAGIDWPTLTRFSFTGAAGDTVWGLVARPGGLPAGKTAPVAFIIHGGPQSALGDVWSDRLNIAAFTARGYAVVSIDFHGSTGYGQAFTDSINRDWGGKPLADLKAGLQAATDRFDFLDASRACAVGGSYGGYMVNWIAGHWPDRFRCLVEDDGVFDARAMNYETDELWSDDWDHGNQPYFAAPDEYEKWNPVNAVANWSTPMLVITGGQDFRSPATQAIATFTALQRRQIPSRLIVFPDEGHWVQRPRNSAQWYDEVLGWMDRWTGDPG